MSGHEDFIQETVKLAKTYPGQFVTGLEAGLEIVDEHREKGEFRTHHDHEQAIVTVMNRIYFDHIEGAGLVEDEEQALVRGAQEAIDEAYTRDAQAAELAA